MKLYAMRSRRRPRAAALALWAALGLVADGVVAGSSPKDLERIEIRVGDFVFDALAAGPEEGPLVLLLHGFPQTGYSFRAQLAALAEAGYRAVAPDQRGYSPGARPTEVEAYGMSHLVGDVLGMADALGRERFHLVGHDWGGAVAWATATRHPNRVVTLSVLSTPHFRALGRALADGSSDQAERSSYFGDFAAPGAERQFLADDQALLRSLLEGSGATEDELRVYLERLGTPEAMRAALHWYGALVASRPPVGGASPPSGPANTPRVTVPTLYAWGTEDGAFGRAAAEATREFVAGPYAFYPLEGYGHWLPESAAEVVTPLILAHIGRGGASGAGRPTVTTLATREELLSNGRLGGVSVGLEGDLYVANFGRTVWRVSPTGEVEVLDQSFQGSSGNAIGPDGALYQASFLDGRIVRLSGGRSETYVAEGLSGPVGLAFDRRGNLYVCNCRDNSISVVRPDRAVELFARSPDLDCPNGLTLDAHGELVVVSFKNGRIVKVSPEGEARRFVELPEGGNAHVAAVGDSLYVTKAAANRVYRVGADGSYEVFAGSGERGLDDGPALDARLSIPNGIAVAPDGSALFVNNLEGAWRGDEITRIVLRRIDLRSGH